MKKITSVVLAFLFVFTTAFTFVQAEETTTTSSNQVSVLMELIQKLKDQLAGLQKQNKELKQEVSSLREFAQNLSEGSSSDDVKDVQEILAGYEDIYPEGVVSGYYGSLTKEAVKRFQKKIGIEATGTVGPVTRQALNDLLDDGQITEDELKALPSGIAEKRGLDKPLPPGLLKNLKEKRGFAKMMDDSDDDEDEDEDIVDDKKLSFYQRYVQGKIKKAMNLASELKAELANSSDTESLADVEALIEDAKTAFAAGEYSQAKELAKDAIDLAKDSIDEIEDADDEDEDETEDESEDDDSDEDEDDDDSDED